MDRNDHLKEMKETEKNTINEAYLAPKDSIETEFMEINQNREINNVYKLAPTKTLKEKDIRISSKIEKLRERAKLTNLTTYDEDALKELERVREETGSLFEKIGDVDSGEIPEEWNASTLRTLMALQEITIRRINLGENPLFWITTTLDEIIPFFNIEPTNTTYLKDILNTTMKQIQMYGLKPNNSFRVKTSILSYKEIEEGSNRVSFRFDIDYLAYLIDYDSKAKAKLSITQDKIPKSVYSVNDKYYPSGLKALYFMHNLRYQNRKRGTEEYQILSIKLLCGYLDLIYTDKIKKHSKHKEKIRRPLVRFIDYAIEEQGLECYFTNDLSVFINKDELLSFNVRKFESASIHYRFNPEYIPPSYKKKASLRGT